MAFWPFKQAKSVDSGIVSLDEFLGKGSTRDASPLDLARDSKDWQKRLMSLAQPSIEQRALQLTAFSLIRGGDLFERGQTQRPKPTDPSLVETYASNRLRLVSNKVSPETTDAALQGVLKVVSGNPAICLRMMIAKPIDVIIVPRGDDYRSYGFPRNTNPRAAGIFYNQTDAEFALLGLREEYIHEKPWLMVHEMTHAVHLMGMTSDERKRIDAFLMPVYRSRRWVEEAVAIYAERAFGARYTPEELAAPDLYGKTRREWTDQAVFSLFMSELLRPQ